MRIGTIGYGSRIGPLADLMEKVHPDVRVTAITDVRNVEIRQKMRDSGKNPDEVAFYTVPEEMLDREKLDGVMIGTRCSLHARMATKVFERNLPVFLEKPIATNMDDLVALVAAGEKSTSKVVVSFPLRVSPIVRIVRDIIDAGKIGTVEHVEAWNDVAYGDCYYLDWYRDENETQGLFLQKTTHDFDYINYLLGTRPVWVSAMKSKRVMKGDHPAGLLCDECTEHDTCLESPFHRFFTRGARKRTDFSGRQCCFAVDTGNEDSGSALVEYESGMHVAYSQNFFVRNAAGRRGARFYGYLGTVEFDWTTDEVKVFMHHSPQTETIKVDTARMPHGGGDTVLLDNFVRVCRGERETVSPLCAGYLSTLMCLKAKESSLTRTFQEIRLPGDDEATSRWTENGSVRGAG
jgi:predicted dehydrogenase